MRKLARFLFSEELIVIFFSLILLACSYGPLAWQYLNPPPGKIFLGSFGFPHDFFGNLISFQEGRLGHWRHFPKLTSTVTGEPTLIKFDYIFLGQLSRLFPINPVVFFHLSRLIFSISLIIVSYWLISQIFKKKHLRLTAFLLAFFSTTLDPNRGSLVDLWTPLTVFQRSAYYPHYLFSFIFILLALYFLYQVLSYAKLGNLILACFFGFLSAWTHPPSIITVFLTFPIYLFLTLLVSQFKAQVFLRKLIFLVTFCLISSLPLLYLFQVSSIHPWNLISRTDVVFNISSVISLWKFLTGIGPLAILAIIGAYLAIRKGNELSLLLAPWSIVYFLGFFFLWKIIGYNSVRFLQTPFYLILGILSAFILDALPKTLAKKWFWLVLLILLLNLPAYNQNLKDNLLNFSHLHPYINTSPEMVTAINWLSQNTDEKEIILTGETNGMLIAGLAGNLPYLTPYARHLDNFFELENKVRQFLSQSWREERARQFITQEKIGLIFFGEQEKNLSLKNELQYSFLTKAFENPKVIIYRTHP